MTTLNKSAGQAAKTCAAMNALKIHLSSTLFHFWIISVQIIPTETRKESKSILFNKAEVVQYLIPSIIEINPIGIANKYLHLE